MERLTEERQLGPFASLKDKSDAVPGAFGLYDCLYSHMIAVTKLKRYEDTGLEPEEIMERIAPFNPPLTLDELREMDGQPVWVETPGARKYGRWGIVYGVDIESQSLYLRGDYSCHDYGNTWLAYRRKPEEREGGNNGHGGN